jgi:SAM-dependent methyltransferase
MSVETYVHLSGDHNMGDPDVIVPMLNEYFKPTSVLDYGCGIGNFMHKFKECGVSRVLGIDGEWANNNLQMLKGDDLLLQSLTDEIKLNERFDMAISFEVAEHIPKEYAEKVVRDLTRFSDLVIFSAAIPNQGGQNHVNEQWPSYWVKLFNSQGYVCYDPLRPLMWDNDNIRFWYRQNMFVAIKEADTKRIEQVQSLFPQVKGKENIVLPLVHPLQFQLKITRINRLVRMFKGKASFNEYKEEIMKVFSRKYG